MTWGFIGLGQMGLPMARRLSRVVDVLAHDPHVVAGDLTQADDLAGLAGCSHIVTCLPTGDVVRDVLAGLVPKLVQGTVIIDTSTTCHATAETIGGDVSARGMVFLDAPVSGMQARAEDGTLTMMVGGDGAALNAVHDALSAMASNILHVGEIGAGQLAKTINNLLFDINMAAVAEVMPMAVRMGLDPDQIAAIVNSGTGRSYASEFFLPNILNGVFDKGYPMQAAYKNLVSGAEIAAQNAIPAPVLAAATATYQQALAEGYGQQDKGAMIKVFERLTNTQFRSKT